MKITLEQATWVFILYEILKYIFPVGFVLERGRSISILAKGWSYSYASWLLLCLLYDFRIGYLLILLQSLVMLMTAVHKALKGMGNNEDPTKMRERVEETFKDRPYMTKLIRIDSLTKLRLVILEAIYCGYL